MILFLSKKESEAIKTHVVEQIKFFNNQYHSVRVSMKNLCPHIKDYATFAKAEMKKAEESVKFWEGILKRLK